MQGAIVQRLLCPRDQRCHQTRRIKRAGRLENDADAVAFGIEGLDVVFELLVVAAMALVYSLYALSGAGTEALAWGVVLLLAGVPVYLWMRRVRVR